ncbi:MAG: hypothetical protein AB1768_13410 [Pseudomonadota bacterium]|jgi:hypothetical protein
MNEKNSARPVDLAVGHYRFVFASDRVARFSDFSGSAWRGALGHTLKRTVCVTRQSQCRQCLLYRSCVYPYFYDTPPHAGAERMRRYETAPHPFVQLGQGLPDRLLEGHASFTDAVSAASRNRAAPRLRLQVGTATAWADGERLDLGPTEFAVLLWRKDSPKDLADYFEPQKSRINKAMRQVLGEHAAERYAIRRTGPRGASLYYLPLAPQNIDIREGTKP